MQPMRFYAFYRGNYMAIHFADKSVYDTFRLQLEVTTTAVIEEMIKDGLDTKIIGDLMKHNLEYEGPPPSDLPKPIHITSDLNHPTVLWFFNKVACLLHIKAIEDDKLNGFLVDYLEPGE
jgi:hypothetical protein